MHLSFSNIGSAVAFLGFRFISVAGTGHVSYFPQHRIVSRGCHDVPRSGHNLRCGCCLSTLFSCTTEVIADAVQMANDGHTWQQIQHRAVHQAAKSDEVFTINAVHAVPTLSKGGQSLSHLSTELVHFLAWLGHRELCFKSDGEPAQVYEVWIAQVEPSMDMKNWSYLVLFLAALAFLAFMVPSGTSGCKHPSDRASTS